MSEWVEDDRPVVSIAKTCACGATVEGCGERRGTSADLKVTCDACGRRYTVTITEFSGPCGAD